MGPTLDAPMGDEGLVDLTIGPLLGTQINTLYWQLGTDPYKGTAPQVASPTNTPTSRRWDPSGETGWTRSRPRASGAYTRTRGK